MSTTPLWVPLVVAGLGLVGTVVGTLAGVLITQRRADLRETTAWERERDREGQRWAREDAAKTFDHRREAYIDFYESLRDMASRTYNLGLGLSNEEELPFDWQLPTYRKLQHLNVYATPSVTSAASMAYSHAWRWGQDTTFGEDDDMFYELQEIYDDAEGRLLIAIQSDLAIPGS